MGIDKPFHGVGPAGEQRLGIEAELAHLSLQPPVAIAEANYSDVAPAAQKADGHARQERTEPSSSRSCGAAQPT